MSIIQGKIFKLFNSEELELYNNNIQKLYVLGPTWDNFKTRTANRKFVSFIPDLMPLEYTFLKPMVDKILTAASNTSEDQIIPMLMFINYYKDGSHSTPIHKHGCRQITVSFGCPRILKVNTKNIVLETGDAIFLNKQRHGVPSVDKNDAFFDVPRISFNLFFTTSKEQRYDIAPLKK